MKKIAFILSCFVFPFLVSCERNIDYDEMYSAEYDIRSSDWTPMDTYYTVPLNVRQITKAVCTTGSVQCFRMYNDGSQAALPLQRYESYEIDNPETGQKETGYYQTMIDFEYGVGTVNLYYQTSDFYYDEDSSPGDMRIRVVVHF